MKDKLASLQKDALKEISDSKDTPSVEQIRIKYLGKKGQITDVLKGLGSLSAEERPAIGELSNKVKTEIAQAIDNKKIEFKAIEIEGKIATERIDVTLPGRRLKRGTKHLITKTFEEIREVSNGN